MFNKQTLYSLRSLLPLSRSCVILWVFLFFIIPAGAQQTTRIYLDQALPEPAKQAIRELYSVLKKGSGPVLQLDSISRFSGEGIYFTTRSNDYFRKAPTDLSKLGAEGIYIKSGNKAVYGLSNSPEALSAAIYTYLDKIGIRFYFPDPAWHVRPKHTELFSVFEIQEEPDFAFRNIFMGWGYGSNLLRDRYLFWEKANRMGGSLQVKAGHIYQKLLVDKKDAFERHPEFLSKPLLNGKKQSRTTLNYASAGLADLAHEWLAEQFDKNEKLGIPTPMLSLEPFDGPNLCNLPSCLNVGKNASDQIFYFTSQVAKRLKKTHPGKLIGVLAYNDHIDIPKYEVEDNIFVTLTSAYNPSPYSTDQLMERWKTKVERMGMYDYLSVFAGTNEMPGRGFGGNYAVVYQGMQKYHSRNIVSYQAESTYGWIPKGLSHYIVSRLSWNASTDLNVILDQFYKDCFPNTRQWIEPVFESWTRPFILTDNDIYQWFNSIRLAFAATRDADELERIQQVAEYIRYITLFKAYDEVKADAVKSKRAATELFAYMHAILEKGVVASHAGINTLAPKLGADFAMNNKNAVWKKAKVDVPASPAEWNRFMARYLPTLKKMGNVREFRKAPFLSRDETTGFSRTFKVQNKSQAVSFNVKLLAIVDTRNSDSLDLKISGGRIKPSGKVMVEVFSWNDEMLPVGTPLVQQSFPSDKKFHTVSLKNLPKGKYVIRATDASTTGAHLYFPRKMRYSVIASPDNPIKGAFYNNYYIYVPKGISRFYFLKTHYFQLFDPSGKRTVHPTPGDKMVEVIVKPGMEGWWRVNMQLYDFYIVGIPPLLSRDPSSYFLPD